ncbi:MAG: O-antigen ligase family protein [Acidobacteria bacterium]|nr:O-antigen ligase family protein [Acidobacteriota bacterium]
MQSTSPVIDERILLGLLVPLFVLPLLHPLGFVIAIALIPAGYLAIYGLQHNEIFLMLTLFAPVLKTSPLNPIPPELDLTVIFYAMFLAVTALLFIFNKRKFPKPELLDILLGIFVLIVIVEFFNAPGKVRDYSLFKLIRFLFLSLPFFFFPRIFAELEFRRLSSLIATIGSGICLALFLVYPDSQVMKASGNSYLTVAAIAGIALFFAAARFVQEKGFFRKLVYITAMTVDLVLVFKTNSRGGMLFGGLVLLFYFLVVFRQKRLLVLFGLMLLIMTTFFTYTLYPDFFTRFFYMFRQHKGASISGRFVVYKLALKLISQRWMTGIGLGGFSDYHFLKYPHNLFLEIFVEHGIAGILVFLAFLSGVFSRGMAVFRRQALYSWRAPYLLGAIFMFLFQMTSFGLESTRLFFFFTGCLIVFYQKPLKNTGKSLSGNP